MTDFPLEALLRRSLKDELTVRFFKTFEGRFKMEPDDDVLQISVPRNGFDLRLDYETNQFYLIFYYSNYFLRKFGAKKSAAQFDGVLPAKLAFNMQPEAILARFGEPIEAGGGQSDNVFGMIPYWMKFKCNDNILHLTFDDDFGAISLVSLTLPEFDVRSF